jgi:hypothetical protein
MEQLLLPIRITPTPAEVREEVKARLAGLGMRQKVRTEKRAMHANSLAAYESEAPRLGARCKLIYDFVKASGRAWTDRQLMTALGFTDPNATRPRITDLIKAGMLEECGDVIDSQTGKRVRLVRAKE